MSDTNHLLEQAEKSALENLRFHLQTADYLVKESHATLVILLAGAGASFWFTIEAAYGANWIGPEVGVAALSLYLFMLCGLIIFKCMKIRPLAAPTDEPKHFIPKRAFPRIAARGGVAKHTGAHRTSG